MTVIFSLQRKSRKNKKLEDKEPVEQKDIQDAIDVLVDDETALKDNLCAKKHCGAGKECRVNENGVAECVCMHSCPEEKDPRRMVSPNYWTFQFLDRPCHFWLDFVSLARFAATTTKPGTLIANCTVCAVCAKLDRLTASIRNTITLTSNILVPVGKFR